MPAKKSVHFGSGAIGRGFVGEFLHNSGYELVFIDVSDSVINQLNNTDHYTVTEIGEQGERQFHISNFRAINSKSDPDAVVDEIATADTVTCAVGPNILKFIAPLIAQGIEKRSTELAPVTVIACENAINATSTLADFIRQKLSKETLQVLDKKARFANSAVDRIVPQQAAGNTTSSLDVRIEMFHEWCVELPPFAGMQHPEIEGVHFVEDLAPYIERKLYTVNTAHATAAYFGYAAHKKLIHEVMADPQLRDIVRNTIRETSTLITTKYPISAQEQQDYADKIISRISNPALEDKVERVGRAPLRKLSRNERLVGPASQLAEMGKPVDYLLRAIEMAFRFQNVEGDDESKELAQIVGSESAENVVHKVCGLEKKDKLYGSVVEIVERVKADGAGAHHGGQRRENAPARQRVLAEI